MSLINEETYNYLEMYNFRKNIKKQTKNHIRCKNVIKYIGGGSLFIY